MAALIWDWIVGLSIAGGAAWSFWAIVSAVIPNYRARVYELPKPEPPAVKVSADLLASMRSEIVQNASKRVLRPSFQKGNRA